MRTLGGFVLLAWGLSVAAVGPLLLLYARAWNPNLWEGAPLVSASAGIALAAAGLAAMVGSHRWVLGAAVLSLGAAAFGVREAITSSSPASFWVSVGFLVAPPTAAFVLLAIDLAMERRRPEQQPTLDD